MHWKLTEDVWWGNRHAVAELAREAGSVLNVAHNAELSPGTTRYNPLVLPGLTPYFRFAKHDRDRCEGEYLEDLTSLVEICLRHKPVLVHCYLGQHRSPAVALYAAFMDEKVTQLKEFVELSSKMYALREDIHVGRFHKTLWRHMADLCVLAGEP